MCFGRMLCLEHWVRGGSGVGRKWCEDGGMCFMQIVKYLRDATHELRYTTMVALLQPAPETYELFDDVLLLSDGAPARGM